MSTNEPTPTDLAFRCAYCSGDLRMGQHGLGVCMAAAHRALRKEEVTPSPTETPVREWKVGDPAITTFGESVVIIGIDFIGSPRQPYRLRHADGRPQGHWICSAAFLQPVPPAPEQPRVCDLYQTDPAHKRNVDSGQSGCKQIHTAPEQPGSKDAPYETISAHIARTGHGKVSVSKYQFEEGACDVCREQLSQDPAPAAQPEPPQRETITVPRGAVLSYTYPLSAKVRVSGVRDVAQPEPAGSEPLGPDATADDSRAVERDDAMRELDAAIRAAESDFGNGYGEMSREIQSVRAAFDRLQGRRDKAGTISYPDFDAIRSFGPGGASCYDCGRLYGDEYGFPDLIIPFDAWKRITPTEDDGGLLCPSCICQRLSAAGIHCNGSFLSGPIESVSPATMTALRGIENIELAIEGRDNRWGVALRGVAEGVRKGRFIRHHGMWVCTGCDQPDDDCKCEPTDDSREPYNPIAALDGMIIDDREHACDAEGDCAFATEPEPSAPVAEGVSELKPCPHCGSTAIVRHVHVGGHRRQCHGCGATTIKWLTLETADAAWNRRVGDAEIATLKAAKEQAACCPNHAAVPKCGAKGRYCCADCPMLLLAEIYTLTNTLAARDLTLRSIAGVAEEMRARGECASLSESRVYALTIREFAYRILALTSERPA